MEALTTYLAGLLPPWLPPLAGTLLSALILKALHDHKRRGRFRNSRVILAVYRVADLLLLAVMRAILPLGMLSVPARSAVRATTRRPVIRPER